MAQSKAYDSNAGQWPQFSGFEPLRPESYEFRVLRLDGNSDNENLRYTMHHKEVAPATRYTALSYSWGAPVPPAALKAIIIENQYVLIRPTLHAFLRTLANYDPEIDLWIDAVCINQNDTEERNSQISMMGRIFATAQKVYVWLGVGDDDTNYAFEHIDGTTIQTSFDERQFAPCAEKIFRSSYWTRRWVIQEFALAQELFIVCGSYVSPWPRVAQWIDESVLQNDERALQTLENFKQLKVLGTQQHISLLELMLRFQDSRCIDRRDKAFALRGIAEDGEQFQPDYKESITDVFFRILSQLPTEKVLPKMTGYRWPHVDATRLQQCLRMERGDVLSSLKDKSSDRLFTSFEYVGEIVSVRHLPFSDTASLFCNTVSMHGKDELTSTLHGTKNICVGDMVYKLQSSRSSPQGLFVIIRAEEPALKVTGTVLDITTLDSQKVSSHMRSFEMIHQVTQYGIVMCSKNSNSEPPQARALFHLSRIAFTMLWLLDEGYTGDLLDEYEDAANQHQGQISCKCGPAREKAVESVSEALEDTEASIEIMPFLDDGSGEMANSSVIGIWERDASSTDEESTSVESLLNEGNKPQEDEYWDPGRDNLSFAAGDGLLAWTTHYLSLDGGQNADHKWRTPLSWAIQSGRTRTAEILIASPNFDYKETDRKGFSTLMHAIHSADGRILEMMLARGDVDFNFITSGRTPLSWAAQWRRHDMVKILLTADRIEPDASDVDGFTPLIWAAKVGDEESIRLLIETNRVDYNRQDHDRRTALSWAAEKDLRGAVELLLRQDGILPDIIDGTRWSPLRWADNKGNAQIVEMLLATGKVESRFLLSGLDTIVTSKFQQLLLETYAH